MKKKLQIIFTEELKKNFTCSSKNILKIKNGILDPVFELLTKMIELDPVKESLKYEQLTEEKELIKHAFMKWAIMHIGIDKKKIENFVADLIFFNPKAIEKPMISETENLFMKQQVSLKDFNSIYSLHTHIFGFGNARIFNGEIEGEQMFSDCVETALRHFFNYILWKNNDFYTDKSLNSKLKEYYSELTYERALRYDIIERTAWNKVVSNIQGAKYKINDKNELKSSVSNIIYAIKYLISSDPSFVYKDLTKEDAHKEIENINKELNKLTKKSIQLKISDYVLEVAKINVDNFLEISINTKTSSSRIIKGLHQPTQKFKGDVESLHILEYSFLSNYYVFDKKIDIYSLFSSILTKNTNINQFLEKCEKLENGNLEKYSKYIGNVMYFAGRNTLSLDDWFDSPDFLKLFEKLKNNNNHQFLNNFLKGITRINVNKYNMPDYIEFVKNNLLIILQSNKKELLSIDLDLKDIFNGFPENILKHILQCKKLEKLELNNIKAKGNIPLELSELINLKELDLSNNEFTGNIPAEIWSLKNLKGLNLSYNNFTGEIPKESHEFLHLNLSYNQLEGKIPFQLKKFKINPQIDTEKKKYDLLVENELN